MKSEVKIQTPLAGDKFPVWRVLLSSSLPVNLEGSLQSEVSPSSVATLRRRCRCRYPCQLTWRDSCRLILAYSPLLISISIAHSCLAVSKSLHAYRITTNQLSSIISSARSCLLNPGAGPTLPARPLPLIPGDFLLPEVAGCKYIFIHLNRVREAPYIPRSLA